MVHGEAPGGLGSGCTGGKGLGAVGMVPRTVAWATRGRLRCMGARKERIWFGGHSPGVSSSSIFLCGGRRSVAALPWCECGAEQALWPTAPGPGLSGS